MDKRANPFISSFSCSYVPSSEPLNSSDLPDYLSFLKEPYPRDRHLVFEHQLPYYRTENGKVVPFFYSKDSGKTPFSEAVSSVHVKEVDLRECLFGFKEESERQNEEALKLKRLILIRCLKILRATATPLQRRITRKLFLSYLRSDRKSFKDIAAELEIPPSTLYQELYGRSRKGRRIGGLFPKLYKRLGMNEPSSRKGFYLSELTDLKELSVIVGNAKNPVERGKKGVKKAWKRDCC